MPDPRVTGRKTLAQGHWLGLFEVFYTDREGRARSWEMAERPLGAGAVMAIPRLVPSGDYILVEQFRVPTGTMSVEFPAGLVNVGEAPEAAALRELREETGYVGRVIGVAPRAYSSPGLTSESIVQVLVEIDEADPANQNAQAQPDEGEHLTVYRVPAAEAAVFLKAKVAAGGAVESKVVTWFLRELGGFRGPGCLEPDL